jgi:hypothetical protein
LGRRKVLVSDEQIGLIVSAGQERTTAAALFYKQDGNSMP